MKISLFMIENDKRALRLGTPKRVKICRPRRTSTREVSRYSEVLARSLRRHAQPLPIAPRPIVGISSNTVDAGLRLVLDAGMNDREVASEHPDVHLVLAQFHDAPALADEFEKLRLVQQRCIRVGAQEVLGEDFL